jgi:hypothetical protein
MLFQPSLHRLGHLQKLHEQRDDFPSLESYYSDLQDVANLLLVANATNLGFAE